MVGEVHFARAASGVAIGTTLREVHVAQGRVGDFGVSHTAITSHTATRDTGAGDLVGALARQLHKGLLDAHLLRRARHVHGDVLLHLVPFELIDKVVGDELRRLVKRETKLRAFELLLDLRQARRRVDNDRVLAPFGSLQERLLEIVTLS